MTHFWYSEVFWKDLFEVGNCGVDKYNGAKPMVTPAPDFNAWCKTLRLGTVFYAAVKY